MKLTKLQRYTAYIIMAHESELVKAGYEKRNFYKYFILSCNVSGLCDLLETILHQKNTNILLEYGLIELLQKQPLKFDRYWFDINADGWQKRIELLNQCISETHPDKK